MKQKIQGKIKMKTDTWLESDRSDIITYSGMNQMLRKKK